MDTEKYKNKLETELATLTDELRSLGIHNPEVSEDWIEKMNDSDTVSADPNDVADRTEEFDSRRAELSMLEGRWNDVRDALQKIESLTYGICEVSGELIEDDRLDANPAARTCKAHMNEVA
ncbi:hypothetical protein A2392_02170 [Candidatus Kaiserbacteria bacterium RIFOXYB1_FULL_46_14]|uniref:Zinc finger DksA/TraR C4-type domain-containing protein n=1 Tax=Candidatus Kaiserbacteria bacterium RIFOXYB1_FULL_46_14 TaxID=1798531 RepID=A0A1F6FI67_9BACT|nr:MAG: hypothetical protein A2392_02170 [Candidatus Kaiserbacteria bacterium RIFOXYB1_FULL_46_14]